MPRHVVASARPFDRILVPARPVGGVETALTVARALARRTGVPLRLLSVGWPADDDLLTPPAAAGGDRAPVIEAESRVVGVGSVARALVAEAEPGTLVCMASHGAYGPARTLAHTVAEEVVRAAPEPVLLVGPHVAPADPLGAGPVVACVDDDQDAAGTVATAARWSRAFGLPLSLVHVAPAPDPAGERRLDDLARRIGGVDDRRVLRARDPARALADLAATTAVAVFVMAPAGRAGWDRVLAGSETASTVRRAAAPVLAVPPGVRG